MFAVRRLVLLLLGVLVVGGVAAPQATATMPPVSSSYAYDSTAITPSSAAEHAFHLAVRNASTRGPEEGSADDLSSSRAVFVAAEGGASGLGDLTNAEVRQIQNVVDKAGRPLDVVGSAAKGARKAGSYIDYTAPSSSHGYFRDFIDELPGLDEHGLLHGGPDALEGPSIRFEPRSGW